MADHTPALGLLTRTLNQSPPSRILPLRLSNAVHHDILIFVTDNAFEVATIAHGGYVNRHSRSRYLLDAKILACEVGSANEAASSARSELLFLTLDNSYLATYAFVEDPAETPVKAELLHYVALPCKSNALDRMGSFIAFDQSSQCIAVAGAEGGLMVFKLSQTDSASEQREQINSSNVTKLDSLGPIIRPEGHVTHLAFASNTKHDAKSVELLMIQVVRSKVVLRQLRCDVTGSLHDLHEPRRISSGGLIPDLIIPIQFPGHFILASGNGIVLCNTANTSGHLIDRELSPASETPHAHKLADHNEVWTDWIKDDMSYRHQDLIIYIICRSDGLIAFLTLHLDKSNESARCNIYLSALTHATHRLERGVCCYIEPVNNQSMLALPAAQSDGGFYMVQMDAFADTREGEHSFTIALEKLQTISSCRPTLDFVSSTLPRSHDADPRLGDSLFVTSGCTDGGRVVELRPGLECSILFSLDFQPVANARQIWTTTISASGTDVILASDLSSTDVPHTALLVHGQEGLLSFDSSDDSNCQGSIQLDLSDPTIHLATWPTRGCTIQVTTRAVYKISDNSKTELFRSSMDDSIIRAEVSCHGGDISTTLIMSPVMSAGDSYQVCQIEITDTVDVAVSSNRFDSPAPHIIKHIRREDHDYVVAISPAALLSVANRHNHMNVLATYQVSLTTICEALLIVDGPSKNAVVLLCGMRDGTVLALHMAFDRDGVIVQHLQTLQIGLTPVNMSPYYGSGGDTIGGLAICASRMFLIKSISDHPLRPFFPTPVWITDKDQLDFQPKTITAVSQIDHDFVLDDMNINGCLAILTGSTLLIASLDENRGPAVARSFSTQKPPARILWSQRLGHFALGGTHRNPSHGNLEALVELVRSSRRALVKTEGNYGNATATLALPGERLNCMTEWIHENQDGKQWAFLLVGTGLEGVQNTSTSGRVHLLQPKRSAGKIESITIAISTKFDSPVRAISLYDSDGFICSHGTAISYFTYSSVFKKWQLVCAYQLHSPALHISTSPPFVYLSTATDSLVTLRLCDADVSSGSSAQFQLFSTDRCPATGQHHVTLPAPISPKIGTLAILSTKTSSIRGLLIPDGADRSHRPPRQAITLFTASLPSSIIRLRTHNTSLDPTTPRNTIVGLTTDGAVMGLHPLDPHRWAVLKYIELLCRRSAKVCPTSKLHLTAGGFRGDEVGRGSTVALGFKGLRRYEGESEGVFESRTGVAWEHVRHMLALGDEEGMSMMDDLLGWDQRDGVQRRSMMRDGWEVSGLLGKGERWAEADMHVDGDIIGRLLRDDWARGRALMVEILEEERRRDDRVGTFVREHFEQEVGMVDEALETVGMALHSWGFW